MKSLSDKATRVLKAFLGVIGEHARGERDGITISTEGLNTLLVGKTRSPFGDYEALRETVEWCKGNELPAFALMLTLDEEGRFVDRNACKLAFRNGVLPAKAELDKAVLDERAEIAAMDEGAVAEAEEMLQDAIDTLNASKAPTSRRALANARNQEIEVKSWDEWLDKYRRDVLDVLVPGEPLVRNRFMTSQEGYKDKAWDEWAAQLDYRSWNESLVGSGDIVGAIQLTFRDGRANWITKRFGGFDLGAKLEAKANGIARFERAAVGFYAGDLLAKDFFDEMVQLLGQQYPAVSHLMFLKDKDAFVPVKPTAFEAGLRKLGIEFYLSGYCSWDNYRKFLGYLESIRERLRSVEPETTLLDAHSILWIIGSGYWFESEGAKRVEKVRLGEMTAEEAMGD